MNPNILFCINNLEIGGAETFLVDLINNWSDDYNIYVILLDERQRIISNLNISKIKDIQTFSKANSTFAKVCMVRKYLTRNNIKICISHLEKPNKICMLASVFLKTKSIVTIHSINLFEKKSIFIKNIYRFLYLFFSDSIIAISKSVESYLLKNLLNSPKIVRIDNGIDFKRIIYKKDDIYSSEEIEFAALGRMEYVKGFDILIDALKIVDETLDRWSLIMIGDGNELLNLKEKVKSLNLNDKISFLGFQSNPYKMMSKTKFLIMPSRSEGLPITLLETLSIGIPIISSDVGILPDIIKNNKNGFIFKNSDARMLASTILTATKIKQDRYIEMSNYAKNSVKNFMISRCVRNYEELVKICLHGK